MPKLRAAITGVFGYVPDYILTNAELEKMVDTNDQWITERTGIKERRILKGEGLATSDMGAAAVRGLLEKTGTAPEDVEAIICATVTADMHFPDTANIIADKVGLKNAFGYDLNAACSGFLFALSTASQFIETGRLKKIIVVGADKMSAIVDYTDRNNCIIFGDGAAAVLLEPCKTGEGIKDFVLKGDGSGRHFLRMKAGGSLHPSTHETVERREHYIYQEGKRVFRYAVEGMVGVVNEVLERNRLSTKKLNWLVPHQANKRIINTVGDYLKIPEEKVMVNIQHYGNTTAATIPLCLRDYESQLKKGDKLVLTAFGGGFTWGALYLVWGYDGAAATTKP